MFWLSWKDKHTNNLLVTIVNIKEIIFPHSLFLSIESSHLCLLFLQVLHVLHLNSHNSIKFYMVSEHLRSWDLIFITPFYYFCKFCFFYSDFSFLNFETFVHPLDTSCSKMKNSKVVIPVILKGVNYLLWSRLVKTSLRGRGLWSYVTDDKTFKENQPRREW